MTTLEKAYVDEDGNHVIVFMVKSACCTKRYTVWKQEDGNYFDTQTMELMPPELRLMLDRLVAFNLMHNNQAQR